MLYDSYPDCEEQTNEINEPESNKLEDARSTRIQNMSRPYED